MSNALTAWLEKGQYVEVLGKQIFVIQEGNKDATPLFILHGYPTCSIDYQYVIEDLAAHYRVVLHDHPGFGLSEKTH